MPAPIVPSRSVADLDAEHLAHELAELLEARRPVVRSELAEAQAIEARSAGYLQAMTLGRLRKTVAYYRRARRAARLADAATWLGFRSARFSSQTGTLIVVVDAAAAGLDDNPELPWATVCDDHARLTCHPTLALATSHAADPLGWCAVCSGDELA